MSVTPAQIEKALTNKDWWMMRATHNANAEHALVNGCKLGAVFVNQKGNYCIYIGISSSPKRPVAYLDCTTNTVMNSPPETFAKIRAASMKDAA